MRFESGCMQHYFHALILRLSVLGIVKLGRDNRRIPLSAMLGPIFPKPGDYIGRIFGWWKNRIEHFAYSAIFEN